MGRVGGGGGGAHARTQTQTNETERERDYDPHTDPNAQIPKHRHPKTDAGRDTKPQATSYTATYLTWEAAVCLFVGCVLNVPATG